MPHDGDRGAPSRAHSPDTAPELHNEDVPADEQDIPDIASLHESLQSSLEAALSDLMAAQMRSGGPSVPQAVNLAGLQHSSVPSGTSESALLDADLATFLSSQREHYESLAKETSRGGTGGGHGHSHDHGQCQNHGHAQDHEHQHQHGHGQHRNPHRQTCLRGVSFGHGKPGGRTTQYTKKKPLRVPSATAGLVKGSYEEMSEKGTDEPSVDDENEAEVGTPESCSNSNSGRSSCSGSDGEDDESDDDREPLSLEFLLEHFRGTILLPADGPFPVAFYEEGSALDWASKESLRIGLDYVFFADEEDKELGSLAAVYEEQMSFHLDDETDRLVITWREPNAELTSFDTLRTVSVLVSDVRCKLISAKLDDPVLCTLKAMSFALDDGARLCSFETIETGAKRAESEAIANVDHAIPAPGENAEAGDWSENGAASKAERFIVVGETRCVMQMAYALGKKYPALGSQLIDLRPLDHGGFREGSAASDGDDNGLEDVEMLDDSKYQLDATQLGARDRLFDPLPMDEDELTRDLFGLANLSLNETARDSPGDDFNGVLSALARLDVGSSGDIAETTGEEVVARSWDDAGPPPETTLNADDLDRLSVGSSLISARDQDFDELDLGTFDWDKEVDEADELGASERKKLNRG